MKICKIKMTWEDDIWVAESEDELGIVLESVSFDALMEQRCCYKAFQRT